MLTIANVIDRLKGVCLSAGSQRGAALLLDVDQASINLVLNRKREPSAKLLAALGLERVVTYRERSGL